MGTWQSYKKLAKWLICQLFFDACSPVGVCASCVVIVIFVVKLIDPMSMYAVVFDLDTNCLGECYPGSSYHGAYGQVRDFMQRNGFSHTQGSVYFGDSHMDVVKCVLAVQRLAKEFPWFATCAKDVRMLRIEENNDLLPAIR